MELLLRDKNAVVYGAGGAIGGAGGRDPIRDYYSGGFQVALG
jgi:hypothetical protein